MDDGTDRQPEPRHEQIAELAYQVGWLEATIWQAAEVLDRYDGNCQATVDALGPVIRRAMTKISAQGTAPEGAQP